MCEQFQCLPLGRGTSEEGTAHFFLILLCRFKFIDFYNFRKMQTVGGLSLFEA